VCTEFSAEIIFSNDELHDILKRSNLEIGDHSSFCSIEQKLKILKILLILVGDLNCLQKP